MKTRIGHYEIVSELGRGGMGVVYKGYEPALARYVAIKELAPALAHDAKLVERFLREARSMAALNDPHIIQIYYIGQDNDQPFFVMEFVDGESLSSLIKRHGRLRVGDALKILYQTAQGLCVAHDHGVIHRDIKPANLMLSLRGQIKIADFGIALANQDFDSKLTGTGEFVGTPGYLSPEICLGKPVDQRSDIFALGIVLFEMLTGRTPFSDESPLKLMLDVVQSDIPDVRELNAEVDLSLATILTRMLAKDPAARFQDMHEFMAELAEHPLVLKGGPLSLKPTTAGGPAATLMDMSTLATSNAPPRAYTRPPAVNMEPGSTQLGMDAAASSVSSRSRWPVWAAALSLLLIALGIWALRNTLFKPTPDTTVVTQPASVSPTKITPTAAVVTTAPPPKRSPVVASTTQRSAAPTTSTKVVKTAPAATTPVTTTNAPGHLVKGAIERIQDTDSGIGRRRPLRVPVPAETSQVPPETQK